MSFHYLNAKGGAWLKSDGTHYELNNGPAPNMPNVVGLEYAAAQLVLQQAGIFVPASLGYFTRWPISAIWQTSKLPPSTVLAQYPTPLMYMTPNDPIVLTMSEFPISVAFP